MTVSQRPRTPHRRTASACAVLAVLSVNAWAQAAADDPAAPPQRVEITGSSIKRIDAETALPVQVITRQDIEKTGVTTASELMSQVSANVGGLTDGASINTGGMDQRGFNSANLRGIGTSSTLVLLNGRRLANFASPGDDSGVDLNNIPAAAIERVEILLDGASAIYGTDAIGGVINFITRKDYRGTDVTAYAAVTQHGGGGKRELSLSQGFGNYEADGFNVFGTLSGQHNESLRSGQRQFIKDYDIPHRLGWLLSSRTFPANIRIDSDQLAQLNAAGYDFGSRLINFSAPDCNPPANVSTPTGIGGVDACTYDYMQDTEIYPKSDKLNFLGRGTLRLGSQAQLFGEVLLSRTKTAYVSSANPTTIEDLPVSLSPELSAAGVTGLFDARLRMSEAGDRTSTTTSDAQRFVLGVSGAAAGWEYDAAFNHSVNRAVDAYTHGYILYTPFLAAVENGTINLFGKSSAAGQAVYDNNQINDKSRVSVGVMDSVDAKFTRSLMTLPGGDLGVAIGAEFRRERVNFTPSTLLLSNEILGDRDPDGIPIQATSNRRNVAAMYGELDAPITKSLDAQLAVRHDRYQGVGGTTNPKVGLRWIATPQALLRGSFGTGFRAPSVSELYRPTQYGSTSILPDPVYCALNDNDYSVCADSWAVEYHSNAHLKPERSRQISLGTVLQPGKSTSLSVDYWNIRKRNLISNLGQDVILANPEKYADLVTRDPDEGYITNIVMTLDNRGEERTSGIDVVFDVKKVATPIGAFSGHLSGTWMLESKVQTGAGEPFVSNLGRFVEDKVVQRWRHRVSVDWERGPLALTLGNTFYASYEDQNSAIDTNDGSVVTPNHVKAYSLWDVSGSWEVTPHAKLRAGVQNLFDTNPPFSNQAYYFISGYDPSYTDPRGRTFYASVNLSF
jgi:iron complex outermembrane receptor protein